MGDDNGFGIILGICGFILAMLALGATFYRWHLDGYTHMDSRDISGMMVQCEANLPRDQTCKLIAVPDIKEKK